MPRSRPRSALREQVFRHPSPPSPAPTRRSPAQRRPNSTPSRLFLAALATAASLSLALPRSHAQITRWDNGKVIPGTENTPFVDGANYAGLNLDYAGPTVRRTSVNFASASLMRASLGVGLPGANFANANLTSASFAVFRSDVSFANFTSANLTGANFLSTTLQSANFSAATVTGATFAGLNSLTPDSSIPIQLATTANYQRRDFTGINLTNLDFSRSASQGQSWASQSFASSRVTAVLWSSSDLRSASFADALLSYTPTFSAVFAAADIRGVNFDHASAVGDVNGQRFSRWLTLTASYTSRDLSGVRLGGQQIAALSFASFNLTSTSFSSASLTGVYFGGANITAASFANTIATLPGNAPDLTRFTSAQFYTTSNYLVATGLRPLARVDLSGNNLTSWDLSNADLTSARFRGSYFRDLAHTTFRSSQLQGADFSRVRGFLDLPSASLVGANFSGALASLNLTNANLRGADFSSARPVSATFLNADLTSANLAGADFRSGYFFGTRLTSANLGQATLTGLSSAQLVSSATYQQRNLASTTFLSSNFTAVSFASHALVGTSFQASNLTSADFSGADIRFADFSSSTLSTSQLAATASYQQRNLSGFHTPDWTATPVDLTSQNLTSSVLVIGNTALLNDADITAARFYSSRLTSAALYSTASYKSRNLRQVGFALTSLIGFDFSSQDLNSATFDHSDIAGANLAGTSINSVTFFSTNLDRSQLTSTASYQNRNLAGARFLGAGSFELLNFSSFDLTSTRFESSSLLQTSVSDADIRGASLPLSFTQLSSTASYKQRDLSGVDFTSVILFGGVFPAPAYVGFNFSNAKFTNHQSYNFDFTSADFTGATFQSADFRGATLAAANLANAAANGLDLSSLFNSTTVNLSLFNINLADNPLSSVSFFSRQLISSNFSRTTLTAVNFSTADLRSATFAGASFTFNATLTTTYDVNLFAGANLRGADFSFTRGLSLLRPFSSNDPNFEFVDTYRSDFIYPLNHGSIDSLGHVIISRPFTTGDTLRAKPGYALSANPTSANAVFNGGTLQIDPAASFTTPTTFTFNASSRLILNGTYSAPSLLLNPGATLSGSGTLDADLTSSGTISPGNPPLFSPGTLTITGSLTSTGSLLLEIASATDYDHLLISGNLSLAGNVQLAFVNGYTPQPGDAFQLFTVGGNTTLLSPTFTLTGTILPPGLSLDLSALPTGRVIFAVPEPASLALATPLLLALRRRR